MAGFGILRLDIVASISYFMIALLFLPPANSFVADRFNLSLSFPLRLVLAVFIFFYLPLSGINNGIIDNVTESTVKKVENSTDKIELEANSSVTNSISPWFIKYYVDEFDEETDSKYLSTVKFGKFSNSATQDSEMYAVFLIDSKEKIAIKLHEYARRNPVKSAYGTDYYDILVLDKYGRKYELGAPIYEGTDRISFNKRYSTELHNILRSGGKIKFKIVEQERPTTNYSFAIDASNYEEAYRQLTGSRF